MSLSVPFEWIQNHFAVAGRIAVVMQQSIKQQGCEPTEYFFLVETRNLWPKLAEDAGCKPGYSPSVETKMFVRELVSHAEARICLDCGVRKAEHDIRDDGRAGVEVCPACWRTRFPAKRLGSAA